MRVLRASTYAVRPWKNGGGTTREILSYPEGSDLDTFGWRISAANVDVNVDVDVDVDAGVPFSRFPGVDRSIALLSGDSMDLCGIEDGPVRITQESAPYSFSGDLVVTASLPNGPVQDLNVMTRRGHFLHRMQRIRIPAGSVWTFVAATRAVSLQIVFVEQGSVRVQGPFTMVQHNVCAELHDALVFDHVDKHEDEDEDEDEHEDVCILHSEKGASCLLVELWAHV
jgi:uncharacterized protein